MKTVHLPHPKFLQSSYAWKKENSFGFKCLIQLFKVEVQFIWESLITFFSSVGKAICSFILDLGIWPILFSQFSPVSPSSCVGQGQNKGQSNPSPIATLKIKSCWKYIVFEGCKRTVAWEPTFISLREKVEWVSPWCKMSGHNDPGPHGLMSLFNFYIKLSRIAKVHCFNFLQVPQAVSNQEVPAIFGDILLSWLFPTQFARDRFLLCETLWHSWHNSSTKTDSQWRVQVAVPLKTTCMHGHDSLNSWKNVHDFAHDLAVGHTCDGTSCAFSFGKKFMLSLLEQWWDYIFLFSDMDNIYGFSLLSESGAFLWNLS